MVVVAQLVEHRFVEAKVTGAAPVYHPPNTTARESGFCRFLFTIF